MNPIKWIFSYLINIVLDLYGDAKFVLYTLPKKMIKGERIIDPEKWKEYKTEMKTITPKDFFNKTWYWAIAIIFALVLGMVGSAKFYQVQCNNFITDNYIDNYKYQRGAGILPNESPSILPFITQPISKPGSDNSDEEKEPPG